MHKSHRQRRAFQTQKKIEAVDNDLLSFPSAQLSMSPYVSRASPPIQGPASPSTNVGRQRPSGAWIFGVPTAGCVKGQVCTDAQVSNDAGNRTRSQAACRQPPVAISLI